MYSLCSDWRSGDCGSLGNVPRAFLVTAAGALCFYLLVALAHDAYVVSGAGEVRAPDGKSLPTADLRS